MKTIQDYIQDAENKVKIGIKAEREYCVNKDKVRSTSCRAYAEASYKTARTAVKKAYALVGLTLPKKTTTIHMCEMALNTLKIHYNRFLVNLLESIE